MLTNQVENEKILADEGIILKTPSFQPSKGKVFSWPTLFYVYCLAQIIVFFIAAIIVNHVYPHMYKFDIAQAPSVQSENLVFSSIEGVATTLLVMISLFYFFGKNKPYWTNPMNLSVKKSSNFVWFFIIAVYIAFSSISLSVLAPLNQSLDNSVTSIREYSLFNASFNAFTDFQNKDFKGYKIDSKECKNINTAINKYESMPITATTDAIMKKEYITLDATVGCLSDADTFKAYKLIKSRSDSISNPVTTVLGYVPAIKKAYDLKKQFTNITTKDWCYILASKNKDQGVANAQQCGLMKNDKQLTVMPKETTFDEFYKNNK